jgi:general secretion pathway protein E
VRVAVAVPIELEAAFDRLYATSNEDGDDAALLDEVIADAEPAEEDAERLKDLASEAPVIRLVNQLIARAVETHASDVHLEPFPDRLRVRYRYDGVLHEIEPPPARLQAAVISRIKIMARLDIAERRLPQDGRIKLTVRGHDIDFRVSTIPSLHGEKVVLRVLDRTAVEFDYEKLGLPADIRQGIERALELPNGMVLVTGPTGSGKTTTLYTGLLKLNTVARNVVTVEDPIEYQLGGINQIQVRPQIGLNFASLLRSILRQDPDVIMIGEIRDLETAQIAVQAALTGHLVLSTVHTNSAAATMTRLRDMGLEDYLMTATLKAVLAQRLVRRLCPECKAGRTGAGRADRAVRHDAVGSDAGDRALSPGGVPGLPRHRFSRPSGDRRAAGAEPRDRSPDFRGRGRHRDRARRDGEGMRPTSTATSWRCLKATRRSRRSCVAFAARHRRLLKSPAGRSGCCCRLLDFD